MNFTLRPYQQDFTKDIAIKLKQDQHIIACSATGSGKTKTFVAITNMAIKASKTVLIITESSKIFTQINDEFDCTFEIDPKVKDCIIYKNAVYVAMAQTLQNRPQILAQFAQYGKDLIVINDEAHIGTSTKVLMQLLDSYIIGFTATPRWKEAKHLTDIYKNISMGKQPQWLIENGYLAPYYHYARTAVNLSNLKIQNGEFTSESQREAFEKSEVYKGIYEDLQKFEFYKCMIFCSNKVHADNTSAALNAMGYKCCSIHTGNSDANYQLYQFENSRDLNVCVSVGMLTKGYDFPAIDLVVLNRATTSLPLYLQMCGRGSRIAPGKNKFTVIDYGGNAQRLGLWNIDREWDKLWCDKIKKSDDQLEAIKDCPSCGFICQKTEQICPSCGHVFINTPPPKKEIETKLTELTDRYNGIRGKKISELTPNELVTYRDFTAKKRFCLRVARAKGDSFLIKYGQLCGLNPNFIAHLPAEENINFYDFEVK